jgi:hypothetical protein
MYFPSQQERQPIVIPQFSCTKLNPLSQYTSLTLFIEQQIAACNTC